MSSIHDGPASHLHDWMNWTWYFWGSVNHLGKIWFVWSLPLNLWSMISRGVAKGKGPHCSASHTAPKLPMPRQKWQSVRVATKWTLSWIISYKSKSHKKSVLKCAPSSLFSISLSFSPFPCHTSVLIISMEHVTPVDPLFQCSVGSKSCPVVAGSVTKRLLDATSAATDGQNSLIKSVSVCLSSSRPLE